MKRKYFLLSVFFLIFCVHPSYSQDVRSNHSYRNLGFTQVPTVSVGGFIDVNLGLAKQEDDYSKDTLNNVVSYNNSGLSIANKLNHKYALKTGTTKTDYWTVGYNKKALMLVWMGYDDARETNSNISGEAKNIWASTIENYEKNVSDEWYEQPKNVIATIRDPVTGNEVKNKEKNTLYYFVKGSENNKEAHVIKQIEEE